MTETTTVRARLGAPLARAHRALTDAGALRTWLAEYAEVDLPHRYEFWGRHTPGGDKSRQRLLHVDDRTLRFAWRLDDEDTTVEISLEPEGPQSTILTLSQTNMPSWEEMVGGTGARSVMNEFWALSIANLSDYLDGRELTPKCDFTSPRLRSEVLIDGTRDAVYDSILDPAKFRRWFGVNIEVEPHVGGRWAMGSFEMDETPGKILELEPGQKMTTAWPDGTVASWELAETGGKTRLTFVQSGFDPENPPYGAWMGWLSGIAELRRFHEVKDWRTIWLSMDVPGAPEGLLALD